MKKAMTTILLGTLLMLSSTLSFAQANERTFVKSFNLEGQRTVFVDIDANITVQTWNNPTLRIQIGISLENGNDNILKSLVEIGRYNMKSEVIDNELVVTNPALTKKIKVGDTEITEKLNLTVFAPEGVEVKTILDALGMNTPDGL